MARTGWYDDNSARSYPFVRGTGFAPSSLVVDAGFMAGPGSGHEAGVHSILMTAVRRQGQTISLVFVSDAPGLAGRELVFARQASDGPYVTEFADDSELGSLSGLECDEDPAFLGHVVTGPLDELLELLPGDGEIVGEARVEPALVVVLSGLAVRTLGIANADRTRWTPPDGCRPPCWPEAPRPIWIDSRCLTDGPRFVEGYNTRILQEGSQIVISASPGAGAGPNCDQPPLFPGEIPPQGSLWLEGGPACSEVVRSINGVGGRILPVLGGLGVRVTPDPAGHRIVVDVNFHDMAVCGEPDGLDGLSCPEPDPDDDPCECGPE